MQSRLNQKFPASLLMVALTLSISAVLATAGSAVAKSHSAGTSSERGAAIEVELKGESEMQSDKDSSEVLQALKKLLGGLGQRNIEQIGECLSPDVTTVDDRTHKIVYGKSDVLAHIKSNVVGGTENSPVRHIIVHNPFVRIKGEMAMVSFRATKQMSDSRILQSLCSEVYERKGGAWLVLQFRTNWKPAKAMD